MRLTRQEVLLIASILAALLIGAAVKYGRDQARLHATTATTTRPNP
jgi:hypothetical protein